jgi:hypothetical protein
MAWFNSEDVSINDIEIETRDAKRGHWALPLDQRIAPSDWRKGERHMDRNTFPKVERR